MLHRFLPVAAVLLIGATLTGPAPVAGAQEGSLQGWWTAASVGGVLPGSVVAPDVPADGLLVQGGSSDDAPVALAALVLPFTAGADVRTVTIQAVASGANLPGSVLIACRLASPDFAPSQGGPVADAPPYDCTDAEAATAGADGVSYTFDARPLVSGDAVALAIVPGSPTTRVALNSAAAATVRSATAQPSTPAPAPPAAGQPIPVAPSTGTATGGGTSAGPTRPAASTAGVIPSGGATTALPQSTSVVTPPTFSPTGFGVALPPAANRLAILLVLAAVGIAGFAWSRAGRNVSFR